MEITDGLRYSNLKLSKALEINKLFNMMNQYFKDKCYTEYVKSLDILVYCDSHEYEMFSIPKRPRYVAERTSPKPKYLWKPDSDNMYHTVKMLFIEIKIDHEAFRKSDTIGGYTIIGNTLLKYLEEMKYPVVLRKCFDRERFNKDMREFFQSLGCKLNVE